MSHFKMNSPYFYKNIPEIRQLQILTVSMETQPAEMIAGAGGKQVITRPKISDF